MTDHRPDSAQELQYPPIRVNRSLAQLDLNTLIMRSSPHHSAQEATSLEDSTYEVLEHPGDLSDDDGHTASVASTSPDDISVTLSETESEGEDDFGESHAAEPSQLAESSGADPLDAHVIAAGEDSTLTERPGLADSKSTFHFKLDERPATTSLGEECIEGCTVLKEFTSEQSSSKVLEPYGCSQIRLTLHVGLADCFYPDRGSFRVLFVGRLDEWSEEGVKASLLNALLASPGSSKSVMVHGQMQPYSPILHTVHCANVKVKTEAGKGAYMDLELDGKDGSNPVQEHGSQRQSADSASNPDLVIFCYPKSSDLSLHESDWIHAHQDLEKMGIPSLHITDHRRFNEEHPGFSTALNEQSLKVHVEGKIDAGFEPRDTLPVDVYTFMHLDPVDLNRHLAAISLRLRPSRRLSKYGQVSIFGDLSRFIPTPLQQGYKSLSTIDTSLKLFLAIFALSGMITASYLVGRGPVQPKHFVPTSGDATPVFDMCSSPLSAVTAVSQAAAATASSPTVKEMIEDMFAKQRQAVQIETTKGTDELRKSVGQHFEQLNEAERLLKKAKKNKAEKQRKSEEAAKVAKVSGFEIQPSGEQQFVLRPSKGFIGRTRKPQLQIQVSRDARTVPIRYERTIDGVYIVDLEKEYPVGSFNVSIATHSKPLMQQSFNINLGNNKTRVEQWLSLIKRESITTRQQLRVLSSDIVQQLQAVSARIADKAQGWKDKVVQSSQDMTDRMHDAAEQLGEARDQTWMSLRKATAPVRTSQRTLWARNNAHVLRCGFERAVGLSSKDDQRRRTRSCEAANW